MVSDKFSTVPARITGRALTTFLRLFEGCLFERGAYSKGGAMETIDNLGRLSRQYRQFALSSVLY